MATAKCHDLRHLGLFRNLSAIFWSSLHREWSCIHDHQQSSSASFPSCSQPARIPTTPQPMAPIRLAIRHSHRLAAPICVSARYACTHRSPLSSAEPMRHAAQRRGFAHKIQTRPRHRKHPLNPQIQHLKIQRRKIQLSLLTQRLKIQLNPLTRRIQPMTCSATPQAILRHASITKTLGFASTASFPRRPALRVTNAPAMRVSPPQRHQNPISQQEIPAKSAIPIHSQSDAMAQQKPSHAWNNTMQMARVWERIRSKRSIA